MQNDKGKELETNRDKQKNEAQDVLTIDKKEHSDLTFQHHSYYTQTVGERECSNLTL